MKAKARKYRVRASVTRRFIWKNSLPVFILPEAVSRDLENTKKK
jgi:hypothetical protein